MALPSGAPGATASVLASTLFTLDRISELQIWVGQNLVSHPESVFLSLITWAVHFSLQTLPNPN